MSPKTTGTTRAQCPTERASSIEDGKDPGSKRDQHEQDAEFDFNEYPFG